MIWDFTNMLRRLRRRQPLTHGELLRRAMREAAAGERPETLDMLRPDHMHVYPGRRERFVLRDGTPYEESGADEHDWRL